MCLYKGYINGGAEQRLRVLYLPGVPEVFEKRLQLQVAFLPPEEITLTGMGVFPRITLKLPRNLCMHKSTVVNTVNIQLAKQLTRLILMNIHDSDKMIQSAY